MKKIKLEAVSRLLAALGIILFIYVLFSVDIGNVWRTFREILWVKFLVLLGLRLLYWVIRTFNWRLILNKYESRVSFGRLFFIRLASNTVNYLMPTANIGGEAFRVVILKKMDRNKVTASVVVDKSIEILSTFLLTFLAFLFLVMRISIPNSRKTLIILVAALPLVGVWYMYKKQKQGFFTWIFDSLKKIKIQFKAIERNRDRLRETDDLINTYYREHKRQFVWVFALYVLQLLVWTFELYLTFIFIGLPNVAVVDCFLILNLTAIVSLLPSTPGSLGIFEFSNISMFTILNIPMTFGLTSILIRRILGYLLAGIGLIPMLLIKKSSAEKTKPASIPVE